MASAVHLSRASGTACDNLISCRAGVLQFSRPCAPLWHPSRGPHRLSATRQGVARSRRALLQSTALLTLPKPGHAVSQQQQQPSPAPRPAEQNGNSVNGSSGSGSEDEAEERHCRPPPPPLRITAPGRIVAVGDIHGDLQKAIALLKLAGVVEEIDRRLVWTGGDTTVVQLGDVLDRGSQEIMSLQLLRNLDQQARQEGGAVWMINGNHESLNVAGDFRYATEGGMLESAMMGGLRGVDAHLAPNQRAARLRLFSPGGHLAKELANNPTVLIVNDTMFAHGGVLMGHVQYGLERINAEVAAWMRGDRLSDGSRAPPPFLAMGDRRSVMWNRTFSQECFGSFYDKYHASNQLKQVLERTNCSRLVIGHTPQQKGLNCECDGKVWRVDVGMSSGVLNAQPQALEINKSEGSQTPVIRVLGEAGRPTPVAPIARPNSFMAQSFGSVGSVHMGPPTTVSRL